jgi:hypothetical protein
MHERLPQYACGNPRSVSLSPYASTTSKSDRPAYILRPGGQHEQIQIHERESVLAGGEFGADAYAEEITERKRSATLRADIARKLKKD